MIYKIKHSKSEFVFWLFLFVMGMLMLNTCYYSIKEREGWFAITFFLLLAIFMFSVLLISSLERKYIVILKDKMIIHQNRKNQIIQYKQIIDFKYSISNKNSHVIIFKTSKKKIKLKIEKSEEFISLLNNIVQNNERMSCEMPLDMNNLSQLYIKPSLIIYSKWTYWLFSTLLVIDCSLIYVYTTNLRQNSQWIFVLIAIIGSICICAMTIHQVSLDKRGIKITRVFPFFNKIIPWVKVQGIGYKNDEKVPFYQPGHGPKSKTVVLTLADNSKYYLSMKEHNQFYHEVKKKIKK